jgi:hypothetical protein
LLKEEGGEIMFWKKDKMTFDRKLRAGEKLIISTIVDGNLTEHQLIMIEDFIDGRRFMSRYHAGQKKEKPVREKKVGKPTKLN